MTRHNIVKTCFLFIVSILLFYKPASALTVFDPTNYAQNLLTATRSLTNIENQIKQLANEAQMLVKMDKNLLKQPSSINQNLQGKLEEIQELVNKAKGLALKVEETRDTYKRLYPEQYEEALTLDKGVKLAQERWDTRLNAFKRSMGLQAQIAENVEEDTTHLKDLLQKSQNSEGNLQALQTGNELLALNVKQLLQLQILLSSQGREQSLTEAENASKAEESRLYFRKFIGDQPK